MKLKYCSLCGGNADFALNNEWFDGCYRALFAKCMKCGAVGKPVTFAAHKGCPSRNGGIAPTMDEAKVIAASYWNTKC